MKSKWIGGRSVTYSNQSSLQHYGVRGMEWGKKKKKPLLSGIISGAASKAVYPVAQTVQSASNKAKMQSARRAAATGVASSLKTTATAQAKKINTQRSVAKGLTSGAINTTKRPMSQVITRAKTTANVRQGAASGASTLATQAKEILDAKNLGPKTVNKAQEGAKSVIAAKATDAVKDITTVPGSTADKGVQMIAKLFGTKASSVLKSATSKTISSKTSVADTKKKKPAREWQYR